MLVHTDVVKYLEFKAVDGSFVLNKGRVEKVPATDYEALRSPLMGLFEKRRARSFFMCALALARQPMVRKSCPRGAGLAVFDDGILCRTGAGLQCPVSCPALSEQNACWCSGAPCMCIITGFPILHVCIDK